MDDPKQLVSLRMELICIPDIPWHN